MTERLYYADAYLRTFEARIVHRSDDGRRVVLDRSAFYPTSGGQPHDRGVINDVAVIDVRDDDDRVTHILESPVRDETVHGTIDWTRRHDFMQQHTGQHLLSAILADAHGAPTVSVHFGDLTSTLDVEGSIGAGTLRAVAERANALVAEARQVHVSFEDAGRAQGLRKPSDRGGVLRIVAIDGVDRSACGGTHVRTTAEIGPVLLRGMERIRSATRIEFLCGARALGRANGDAAVLTELAQALTCAPRELPALVRTLAQERKAAGQAIQRLEDELASCQAREAYATMAPGADGRRRLVHPAETGPLESCRALAIAWSTLPRTVALFAAPATRTLLLTASEDAGVDAGTALRAAVVAEGGKGGGSARLAQGTVPTADAFDRVVAILSITGA